MKAKLIPIIILWMLASSCKKNTNKQTNQIVAGYWVDTAYTRFMWANSSYTIDTPIDQLLYEYTFHFKDDGGFEFHVFGDTLPFGKYNIKNDSVVIFADGNNIPFYNLKIDNTNKKMEGKDIADYELHLVKL